MASASSEWNVVLRNQAGHVVAYHPPSQSLHVRRNTNCPVCRRPWASSSSYLAQNAPGYFSLLSSSTRDETPGDLNNGEIDANDYIINDNGNINNNNNNNNNINGCVLDSTSLPQQSQDQAQAQAEQDYESYNDFASSFSRSIPAGVLNTGYFDRFFVQEAKLGRGQRGSVYSCRHVLDGNLLARYAIKKISVGNDSESLLAMLREVRLLETLRHPHIISYHHCWVELARLSLGPSVPVLFVLMEYANGGSLDSYLRSRRGLWDTATPLDDPSFLPKSERIQLFKQQQKQRRASTSTSANHYPSSSSLSWSSASSSSPSWAGGFSNGPSSFSSEPPVHYLSCHDILHIFGDVVDGLAFLHDHNVLHLDLKAENVLLQWDSSNSNSISYMRPKAMLADFGSSRFQSANSPRSGNTGTIEYIPPEAFKVDSSKHQLNELGTYTDLWSLGLILHLLIFFCLPYHNRNDNEALIEEIKNYPGFFAHTSTVKRRHDIPLDLFLLLASLVHLNPHRRPSASESLATVDRIKRESNFNNQESTAHILRESHKQAGAKRYSNSQLTRPDWGNIIQHQQQHLQTSSTTASPPSSNNLPLPFKEEEADSDDNENEKIEVQQGLVNNSEKDSSAMNEDANRFLDQLDQDDLKDEFPLRPSTSSNQLRLEWQQGTTNGQDILNNNFLSFGQKFKLILECYCKSTIILLIFFQVCLTIFVCVPYSPSPMVLYMVLLMITVEFAVEKPTISFCLTILQISLFCILERKNICSVPELPLDL